MTSQVQPSLKRLKSLSVFFPLHNEAQNVDHLVKAALTVLPTVAKRYEVILVNDGSTDRTSTKAHRWAKKFPQIRVIDQPNLGYGGALRTGFTAARYDWVFFSDGDLQFDLHDLKKLVAEAATHKVVLGYRLQRADHWSRRLLARMLKLWNQIFFNFPRQIKDIDCAFKLMHRSVVEDIFPLRSQGAMISTELLLKILDQKVAYTQVGVPHYARQFGHQTGARWHVIKGAIKETARLWYWRHFRPAWDNGSSYRYLSLPVMLGILIYNWLQARQ